jgi:hypothetical protein
MAQFDMAKIEGFVAQEKRGYSSTGSNLARYRIVSIVPFVGTAHWQRAFSPVNDAMAFRNSSGAPSNVRDIELPRHMIILDEGDRERWIGRVLEERPHNKISYNQFGPELKQDVLVGGPPLQYRSSPETKSENEQYGGRDYLKPHWRTLRNWNWIKVVVGVAVGGGGGWFRTWLIGFRRYWAGIALMLGGGSLTVLCWMWAL